ncbi:hypothetical protein AAG906_000550 [Vitis piasezkii]
MESLKRINRHLLEVVRASLIAAKTPISYWGEAITSATYLINRVPSSSINFQTPLQALTNVVVAPTVPNLPPRVFGCVAFVYLHKHQRTKLTSHALQCVFVGYALHKKGYRCYHPPTRQMYITMDVVFHEDSMYFSSEFELQEEYHKEIQTLDYDYHISEDDESGQSELVNQEAAIPNSVQEALADPRWKATMNEEMKSLQKNETWELVELATCTPMHMLTCTLIHMPMNMLTHTPVHTPSAPRKCLTKISAGIRGSIEQHENVRELLKAIDEQFVTSNKALASTLIMKFTSLKLTDEDIVAQLKKLEVEMSESFLVHFILNTLPLQDGPFKISYNTHKDKWSINELMTMCVQEEGRLLMEQGERHVKKKCRNFRNGLRRKIYNPHFKFLIGYAKPKEASDK